MASITGNLRSSLRRLAAWRAERRNRAVARRARVGRAPRKFRFQPDPHWIGDAEHAHRLIAGVYVLAGQEVKAPRIGPWKLKTPSEAFSDALHGFDWIADFAAVGGAEARRVLTNWVFGWIAQYGDGEGPGWTPALAGRRLMNWTIHAPMILRGVDEEMEKRFLRSVGAQARYLRRTWRRAPPGLKRFEALTGLVYAGLCFSSLDELVRTAIREIGAEAERRVGPLGEIDSRNPEELEEILTLLVWTARVVADAGRQPDERHLAAIQRIGPTLRTLRFSDGGLARFHGGGEGGFGKVDYALAESRTRGMVREGTPMGYLRVGAGRTALIMDAAAPPKTAEAHASTLAFEMSSGRRRLIVSSGHGGRLGRHWARSSRATISHSTLSVEKRSSSTLRPPEEVRDPREDLFVAGPSMVTVERSDDIDGTWVLAKHDGYLSRHGLIHQRRLFVSLDGRDLRGEDSLVGPEGKVSRAVRKRIASMPRIGVAFDLRFHIHPDVEVTLTESGSEATLALEGGELWVFAQEGGRLSLESSSYFDDSARKPRATKQIVVTGRAVKYAGRVTWAFRRVQDGRRGAGQGMAGARVEDAPSA